MPYIRFLLINLLALIVLFESSAVFAQEQPVFSKGDAQVVNPALMTCEGKRSRISSLGRVVAEDGSRWVVPAPVHFSTSLFASDLYNDCSGKRHKGPGSVELSSLPVQTQSGGTDVYTAYIFADNYFEFYVDGKLIAIDPVVFTPFNSNVIRFTAKRPFTVATMLVDWEENLGIGTESNRGASHHPGDGGFVAVIKDSNGKIVAITDKSWRAQTFYIAPLENRNCLKVEGGLRDSRNCRSTTRQSAQGLSAAHWPLPKNWADKMFDDSSWPNATVFSNDTVGVDNKRAYTNFTSIFDDDQTDARFIWSPNLVLDNLVLVRKVVR